MTEASAEAHLAIVLTGASTRYHQSPKLNLSPGFETRGLVVSPTLRLTSGDSRKTDPLLALGQRIVRPLVARRRPEVAHCQASKSILESHREWVVQATDARRGQ